MSKVTLTSLQSSESQCKQIVEFSTSQKAIPHKHLEKLNSPKAASTCLLPQKETKSTMLPHGASNCHHSTASKATDLPQNNIKRYTTLPPAQHESFQTIRVRRASVALHSKNDNVLSLSPSFSTILCAGCGSCAELCFSCFTHFRQQDGARYKTQLVQAVDSLFAKATTRAFRRMAAIVLQWVFQSWKAVTKRSKRKNHLALKILEKLRIRRIWTSWRLFVYERHMIGTMMFAKARQREAKENMLEIAKLHGDNFERESADRMQNAIQREIVQKLEKQLAAERSLVQLKDRQLLELRGVENMLTLENV
ncbi:hypothetical protein Plhal304r1_c021g0074681 [Plasmopara halstedii]